MIPLLLISTALAQIPDCRELYAAQAPAATERLGLLRNTAWLGLRAFQVLISPADGAGCTLYPSCSQYAILAIQQEGPVLGGWMALARVMRDHHDPSDPLCRAGHRLYHYAPPQDDTWWRP